MATHRRFGVSDPAANSTGPRWSPDGKLLSYSASGQWFVRTVAGGQFEAKPFQIPGIEGPAVFSPDNRWIAFTKKVPHPKKPAGELSEFERLTQERFKGRMYDWMNFRFDGRGYLPDARDPGATPPVELFLVSRDGGEPKQLTSLGVSVVSPAWSPDSRPRLYCKHSPAR